MIYDNLKNAETYFGLDSRLTKAFKYLQEHDFTTMEPGRYEIEGSNLFALVQTYQTKKAVESYWEAHQEYIDIQYVASGNEQLGYAPLGTMNIKEEYNPDKDKLVLEGEGLFLPLTAGSFAVLYPQDIHMPGITSDQQPVEVTKVVVKVKVD